MTIEERIKRIRKDKLLMAHVDIVELCDAYETLQTTARNFLIIADRNTKVANELRRLLEDTP